MGPPPSSTRFSCMSGHNARTWQNCPGVGGKRARRSCRKRRWLLVRSRSRSGFVQGLAFRNGGPHVKHRFLCMSGHEGRTRQDCPGAGGRWRGVDAGSGVGVCSGAEGCLVRRSDRKSLARRTRQPSAGSTHVRFRSRPRLHVSGKVHVTSAAGHLPSVRGRLVGRLHDAWSNPVPERPSPRRARTRWCGSATRQGTTSSGTASRQGDVRRRAASQEARPVPSLFVTDCRSVAAMLMPDPAASPDPGRT